MWKFMTETKRLYILIDIILALKLAFEDILRKKTEQTELWNHEVGRAACSPEEMVSEIFTEVTDTVIERIEHDIKTTNDTEIQRNIQETEDMIVEYEVEKLQVKKEAIEADLLPTLQLPQLYLPTTMTNTYLIEGAVMT